MLHRLAQRDLVGIFLIEPCRVELTDQRARPEKRRLVALSFFLREADHLDAERQSLATPMQFTHAHHRHEDAQPPIVFAAVANGVVMRPGEQAFDTSVDAEIHPHHIPDRVDPDLIEPAFVHPQHDLPRARAMRIGEVSDGELPRFCISRVAVLRQRFGPIPHLIAQIGRDT